MLSKEMHQHLPHQMKLLSIYIRAGSIPVLPRLAGLWRDGSWDESTCSYRAARAGSRVLVRSSLRERYFTTTSFLYPSKYLCIQHKKNPKGQRGVFSAPWGVIKGWQSYKQWKSSLGFPPQWKVPESKRVPTDIENFSLNTEVSGKSVSDEELLVLNRWSLAVKSV